MYVLRLAVLTALLPGCVFDDGGPLGGTGADGGGKADGDEDSSSLDSAPTPATCKEILDAGRSTGDGVYAVESGPVFCDMTTDGGGWTLVYKKVAGQPLDSFELWTGEPVNADLLAVLDRPTATVDYAGALRGRFDLFTGARLEVIDDGGVAAHISFDATGATSLDWFAPARVTASTWTDLPTDPDWNGSADGRYFSLDGSSPPSARRTLYVNREWGGCANDAGWVMVSHSSNCGAWEHGGGGDPEIIYSTLTTAGRYDTPAERGSAEAVLVFHR